MSDLKELGFMDDAHIELLEEMGVRTVEEFMAQAVDGTSRSELAEITEIPEKMILRWAHLCEILDISEIPRGLVHILEEAGVKEVRDFRNQNAKHLHDKLVELNEAKSAVDTIPGKDDIQLWMDKAARMEPKVV
ncbi:DUF4332 domain-containing protein [Thermodesulfobacteriota bacterium]